ncbi:MAG TPA: dicarboxylate/amino acid:cation symporter [Gemmatales bacterium]|nr:dicarboxylate/amino acid:cation symporter [Gemmatales bacterium]
MALTGPSPSPGRGLSLPTRILIGLVLGAITGVLLNEWRPQFDAWATQGRGAPAVIVEPLLTNVIGPVGQVFLRLLLMTVIPLVFASLAAGVAQLGDLSVLGRIGARTMGYFLLSTATAVVIGLVLVNTIQPGKGLPEETTRRLALEYGAAVSDKPPAQFGVQTFVDIVPRNPIRAMADMEMLGVIFFALLFGIGASKLPKEQGELVIRLLLAVGEIMTWIIHLAMRLAPYGVFCLICKVTAELGFQIIQQLGWYVGTVLFGLALHLFVSLPIFILVLGRVSPWWFFTRVRGVIVTAFSTSSSAATLPTSLAAAHERLGIPKKIAGFVLPLGATMNMNGTALFEGVTVLFLAQVFNVDLTLGQQGIVILLSVLTAIGAAGVPGGAIPLLMMVLASVGVPPTGIALIMGVDRILDMCRTTLNVTGDLTAAVFVARKEGVLLGGDVPPPPAPEVGSPVAPATPEAGPPAGPTPPSPPPS